MRKLPVICAAALAAVAALGLLSACGDAGKSAPPPPAATADAALPGAAPEPHPLSTTGPATMDLTGIEKAANGQSVAELYADKAKWAGKSVTVRGKVVKTNENIMDRTWVHVRDGTGEEGTNDLTITTRDPTPALGAMVVVTGTLSTDKDLGAGYAYPVIVEDGKIVAE